MSFSKMLVFSSAVMLMFGVFADAANVLLSFSTVGPDKYADGKPVMDGEWYALVWSPDGQFAGLKTDCTACRAGDEVVFLAPLAKGERCPFTVFQIDSASASARATGVYAVYQLDTRNAAKDAVAVSANGKPASVNAVVAVQQYEASGAVAGGATATPVAESAWAASAVDTASPDFKQPRISAFKVAGASVKITVSDMMPGVQYNIKMGPSLDALETYGLATPKTSVDNDVDFTVDAKNAKFFKVVREPLAK